MGTALAHSPWVSEKRPKARVPFRNYRALGPHATAIRILWDTVNKETGQCRKLKRIHLCLEFLKLNYLWLPGQGADLVYFLIFIILLGYPPQLFSCVFTEEG